MQSDSTNAPTTSPSPANQIPSSLTAGRVSVHDVMNALPNVAADSPLDFVLKSTNSSVTVPAPKVETPPAATVVPVSDTPLPKAADPMPVFDDAPVAAAVEDAPAVDPDEEEIDNVSDDPVKENYIKLKTKAKEAVKNYKEIKSQYDVTVSELEKYKKGEVVPEVLQSLENKVAELSKWEKLHNLKASDEYRERFVEPLNDNTEKLKNLFKSYGADEEQVEAAVNHALKLDNKADLNRFLAANFDLLGAEEAKTLIASTKQLQEDAKSAELEPAQALDRLLSESAAIKQAQEVQRVEKIKGTSKNAWVEALVDIRNEGKITELIRNEDDPEFNRKFVDPILTKSSQEFGRLIVELAKQGTKELPKELAKGLATMVLRATAQAVAVEARNVAIDHANKLQQASSRVDALFRPPVGGGVPRGNGAPAPKPASPTDAADKLINSVLSKR
jgi:hypothetical protein